MQAAERVEVGVIAGVHGVKGWLKIHSHTEPRIAILDYQPWYIEREGDIAPYQVVAGHAHQRGLIARLEHIESREHAAAWRGARIFIHKTQLPPLAADEYYWADLIGAEVWTTGNIELGTVQRIIATGANDVLVVQGERERLIPFVHGEVIERVDVSAKRIVVCWDPDF